MVHVLPAKNKPPAELHAAWEVNPPPKQVPPVQHAPRIHALQVAPTIKLFVKDCPRYPSPKQVCPSFDPVQKTPLVHIIKVCPLKNPKLAPNRSQFPLICIELLFCSPDID
jgi:hypothetical protein